MPAVSQFLAHLQTGDELKRWQIRKDTIGVYEQKTCSSPPIVVPKAIKSKAYRWYQLREARRSHRQTIQRIVYKAPTDYTKPRQTTQSTDRLYKAPKVLYKDMQHHTHIWWSWQYNIVKSSGPNNLFNHIRRILMQRQSSKQNKHKEHTISLIDPLILWIHQVQRRKKIIVSLGIRPGARWASWDYTTSFKSLLTA